MDIFLHLSVARSAQQLAAMLSAGLAVLGSTLLEDRAIRWTMALGVPMALLTFAAVATFLVLVAFRRDLFLEST